MAALHPRSTPRTPRGEATVAALLDAAAQLLSREDLSAVTTTRIAAAAGVGVGTLYGYFPGKEALACAVATRQRRQRKTLLAEALGAATVQARVYRWVAAWLRHEGRAPVPTPRLRAFMLALVGPGDAQQVLAGLEASLASLAGPEAAFDPLGVQLAVRAVDALASDACTSDALAVPRGILRNALTELVLGQVRGPSARVGGLLERGAVHGLDLRQGQKLGVLAEAKPLPSPNHRSSEDGAHPERKEHEVFQRREPRVA